MAVRNKRVNGLRIYIAGPYTAETQEQQLANAYVAIDAGIAVLLKGHFPFVPHLSHWVDMRAREEGIKLKWEDYIDWDMEWLRQCDALLFLGTSRGANLELEEAQKLNKSIYLSLDKIPSVKN